MKRSVLAVILMLGALFCAFGQSSSPIDLILLLDTSSGMAPSYETVSDYVTGPFLSEFMRVGDTFHLITFSGSPRLDSARRIEGRGDVETIIGRMLIQYPVESGNDAAAAIRYAEDYAASLSSRQKRIVMVGLGAPNINDLIIAARQRLSSINASLDFVLVTPGQPLTNLPSSRTPAAGASPAQTTQAPAQTAQTQSPPAAVSSTPTTPAPEQPSTTASQTPSSTAPSQSQTETTQTPSTPEPQTAPQQSAGTSGVSGEASSLPGETQAGTSSQSGGTAGTGTVQPQDTSVTPPPRGTQGDNNQAAASAPSATRGTGIFSSSLPLLIGIIVLALLILGLIIFFVSRRLGSSPNRVMASVSASKPQTQRQGEATAGQNRELSSYAASQNKQRTTPYSDRSARTENVTPAVINPQGPLLLNLFVEDQNTAIGKRNIHSLKSGYSLTVGGGKSDFLIFLVAVPPNIGEIHRNGSQCTFIPRKPKYFPDLGSSEVRDCINKTIRIVSDKDYELCFRFEMYQDPLETLNKILHSVKVPG
jgi:hypothetical protein